MNDYHVSLILLKLIVSFLYVLKDVSYEQHTRLCRLLCLVLSCQSSALMEEGTEDDPLLFLLIAALTMKGKGKASTVQHSVRPSTEKSS